MTSKTPYEIRLDLINLARDQLNQRFYTQWETVKQNAELKKVAITEVPEFPNTQQILMEAEKLKAFVDKA